MIAFFAGLALGLVAMWHYSRLADHTALFSLKSRQRGLMKEALTHTGSFTDLLVMQKNILRFALLHMRLVALPALLSCSPMLLFLWLRPELVTFTFFIAMIPGYLFAKWRWKI